MRASGAAVRLAQPVALLVGGVVYARVDEAGSAARWVKGIITSISGTDATFAFVAQSGGEHTFTVKGTAIALARGPVSRLQSEPPRGWHAAVGSELPPTEVLLRAAYQLEEDPAFQSVSEAEESRMDVQELVAEIARLNAKLDGMQPAGSRRAAAVADMAAASSAHSGASGSSDVDEDDLVALARRVQKQVLGGQGLGTAARDGGGPVAHRQPAEPLRSMRGTIGTTGGGSSSKQVPQPLSVSSLPAPPHGAGGTDLATLIQLELLKELRRAKANPDEDAEVYLDGTRGLGKTLKGYHKLRRRIENDPAAIIKAYVERMREQVGAETNQPWTMMDVNRRLGWGKFKTLQKWHYGLSQIFQKLDEGEYLIAQAYCVQQMKCAHQASLDNGGFDMAWLLTGLPDPNRKERFGGEPEELEIIGQYMKSLGEVEKRSKQRTKNEDGEDEPWKPKAGGKGGKGGGKGD
jgi:hypothetical protein